MKTYTKEEFEKLYGTTTVNQFKSIKPSGELPQPSLGSKLSTTFSQGSEQFTNTINDNTRTPTERGFSAVGGSFGTAGKAIGNVFGSIPGVQSLKPVGEAVGSAVGGVVNKIASNPVVEVFSQDLAKTLQAMYPNLGAEAALRIAQDTGNIAMSTLGSEAGVKQFGGALELSANVANKARQGVTKTIEAIPNIKAVPNAMLDRIATENPVKLAKIKTGVAKNLNEYADEFSRSRNAISGATNKIDGFDYGTHIAERNLLPDVTDSGRFDGRNIIKGLQDENKQLGTFVSSKLDDSTRVTNLDEFKAGLMEDITKRGGIADAESMRGFVDRYVNEIRTRYGSDLTDKVLYAIKSDADNGYNYISSNADINASKLIADRARQSIRSSDEEIAKALDAQTKNYEAIRITQSLEPYKVKSGNLTTRLAQLGGSLLGANAIEGGIIQKTLGATIGALTGQKLVKALQQAAFISPASRRAIEKELIRKVKPEAVKTILKKLDNGVNLSEVETKALERAGNQLKNSSIITNDKMTATNTSIPKSISPIEKKSNQAGIIKISDNERDVITKDLLSIDTLPVKVNGKLEFGNTDDYFRIQQLQDKVDKKILTDAEYIEAKNLINKVLNRKSNTKKGATAINPLTVGAGVTAIGAGAMSIKNKKK